MENPPSNDTSPPPIPLEVQLVNQTISCQICPYFWEAPSMYGPFPGFNWKEDYPAEMRSFSGFPGEATDWMEGMSQAPAIHRPEVMDGCRKAPIMTIGINPNLTAYQLNSAAAAWAYPQFRDREGNLQYNRYAYYFRYKTFYQVSLDLNFVRDNLKSEGLFHAEKSGWLLSAKRAGFEGNVNQRQITLEVLYDNDDRARTYTFEWSDAEHYVVLFDPHSVISPTDSPQFEAGAVIAGKIDLSTPQETRLKRDLTGYYERMVPILQTLTYLGGTQLRGAQLSVGEDVAQMNMVACASPAWNAKYNIEGQNLNAITTNCVSNAHDKAFVIKQLIQTRPPVLMIVSISSLLMFHKYLGRYFPDEFNARFFTESGELLSGIDDFTLLRATCENEWFLDIQQRVSTADGHEDYELRSRILVVPHFSYANNYMPQVRFPNATEAGSTINEWENYKAQFPHAAQILETGEPLFPVILPRLHEGYDGQSTNVWLLGEEDPIHNMLDQEAWETLIDSEWYIHPNRMIAKTLLDELDAGRLAYNAETGHLERGQGGCKFCDNARWKFPEGCLYNKTTEKVFSNAVLLAVVKEVLWG